MTGLTMTNSGSSQPQKDSTPLPAQSSGYYHLQNRHLQQTQEKMTSTSSPGQPIQLTPLWEHVVRTKRFPTDVDTRSTFIEISERLRDPEWEVRQHALRVLVDVLPTLDMNIIDEVMRPVVPELVSNLGHPAPAVRKGALDTLRVYLFYSQDQDNMVKIILNEGLNRPDALDNFQTNVTMGIILSVPSLLFPSASSPRPSTRVLKETTAALAARLVQVTHQEAALRSLVKIREAIGAEELDSYLLEYNPKVKRDFYVLCEVYDMKVTPKLIGNGEIKGSSGEKDVVPLDQAWGSDSDSSGIAEEDPDVVIGAMPPARVLLETEIKFNEETAITMTILEEKNDESDHGEDPDDESESDDENDLEVVQVLQDIPPDRRKTPRRVHFGGEIVKLRTPDSDDSGLAKSDMPLTKIPLPVSPATKMPLHRRRSLSQPSSPNPRKHHPRRVSRSQSSSPRREIYTHNADLSPKKSILSRTSSPIFIIQPVKTRRKRRSTKVPSGKFDGNEENEKTELESITTSNDTSVSNDPSKSIRSDQKSFEVYPNTIIEETNIEENRLLKAAIDHQTPTENSSKKSSEKYIIEHSLETSKEMRNSVAESDFMKDSGIINSKKTDESIDTKDSQKRSPRPSSRGTFETFPRQERNYILMELSSPVRKKAQDTKSDSMENSTSGNLTKTDTISVFDPEETRSKNSSSIEPVDVINSKLKPSIGQKEEKNTMETGTADQSTSRLIDSFSIAVNEPDESNSTLNDTGKVFEITTAKTTQNELSQRDQFPVICTEPPAIPVEATRNNDAVENQSENRVAIATAARKARDKSGLEDYSQESSRELDKNTDESTITVEGSESVTCSSSEGEGKVEELNWEELSLVSQEILNDLHNKDDWRARVRGLERIASALRTSSALVAIESRLGSLLHSVLGGERSCRVAAAGLAVARVVVAGVAEEALKRRLPQLAWGLARQGGPNAAQLARIAMLRLRPALLLEQFLQPHCIGARNAKTRENALQLLIFSLVTFPSTEFKVEMVANKVAAMVADRRRRVRQAALDTLAVLAQIYEPEEVLHAGERAAKGRRDAEEMMAAIRARLARKSLPLVSADGLVVYGLQISPTVQIATGADVDWIVAGSGSVSPGSGRTRGQIIATSTRLDNGKSSRIDSAKNTRNPWTDRPNLVAVGVGLHSRNQHPVAWQLVPFNNRDDQHPRDQRWNSDDSNVDVGISNEKGTSQKLRLEEKFRRFYPASKRIQDCIESESSTSGDTPNEDLHGSQQLDDQIQITNSSTRERVNSRTRLGSPPPQEGATNKVESKIPILYSRERGFNTKESFAGSTQVRRNVNLEINGNDKTSVSGLPKRRIHESTESHENKIYGSMYQRRKRFIEGTAFQGLPSAAHINNSSDSHYESQISGKKFTGYNGRKIITEEAHKIFTEIPTTQSYQTSRSSNRFSQSPNRRRKQYRSNSEERRYDSVPKTAPQQTYQTPYQRQSGPMDTSMISKLQTASYSSNHFSFGYQGSVKRSNNDITNNNTLHRKDTYFQSTTDKQHAGTDVNTADTRIRVLPNNLEGKLRSRSRSEIRYPEKMDRVMSYGLQTASVQNLDKATPDEAEYNDRNRRQFTSQMSVYPVENLNGQDLQYKAFDNPRSNSASSSTSIASIGLGHRKDRLKITQDQQHSTTKYSTNNINSNSRSSSRQSQNEEKAFDIVPQHSSPRRNSVNSYIISQYDKGLISPAESSVLVIEDGDSQETSTEEETKSGDELEKQLNFNSSNSRDNDHSDDSDDDNSEIDLVERGETEKSSHFISSDDSVCINHSLKSSDECLLMDNAMREFSDVRSTNSDEKNSKKSESPFSDRSISNKSFNSDMSKSPSVQTVCIASQKSLDISNENDIEELEIEEEVIPSPIYSKTNETISFQSLDTKLLAREASAPNSPSRLETFTTDSREAIEYEESRSNRESNIILRNSNNNHMTSQQSISQETLEDIASPNNSNTSTPHSTNLSHSNKSAGGEVGSSMADMGNESRSSSPMDLVEPPKKMPSRLVRSRIKPRVNTMRTMQNSSGQNLTKQIEKPKISVQQCFAQLEHKDWEVSMKGLKMLSQIVRSNPEQLETYGPGTISRVLGKHIRNLRSQVSRVACQAAGDVFSAQIRGIDQELDDIAGPLLHRTADTNKFLRADCNAALDSMIEHLPPHRTISVIVYRGATHQNAIVRAATARLLSTVIDKIGGDHVMTLPREVREKLLGTGAKLLIDGNLDARNYAKKMFRSLMRCDGFRKALTDSVPENTLRHIDKTLKSL
ncbi:uncharacterized protein LOC107270564 isoform X2 [Cephus cinctus]|uniref:Uncharacterized protein LOC107270564 isoform X2 n=1 Tax=Cephus cinctus TaxID=211228 RepID=A0AAJ7C3W1_CEPCN|nr:uncharacterized protein LOC107270564 isoform X2 [Cephus cinctus]